MINVENLQAEIKEKQALIEAKEREIKIANDYISERKQIIAEFKCPFVVGQKVKSKHEGECTIGGIYSTGWRDEYSFWVHKTKKNGEPYINKTRIWDPENFTAI